MNQEIYSIDYRKDKIWGILQNPADTVNPSEVLVIFVHGSAGYRIGPHRIFVDYARELAQCGIKSFRFDFVGCGFSEGEKPKAQKSNSGHPVEPHYIEQLYTITTVLKENLKPKKIILFGICSGAYYSLKYTYYKHVDHLVLLSPSPLEKDDVTIELNKSKYGMKQYLNKLFYLSTWKKLLKAQINFSMVIKPFALFYYLVVHKMLRKKDPQSKAEKTGAAPLRIKTQSALLIFAENDPEAPIARKQVAGELQSSTIPFEQEIIKGANHSFYSLKWKKEILDRFMEWHAVATTAYKELV